MRIIYIVFIDSVNMYNNLMKYTYHRSYLANIFYIAYKAMQTVIYSMWKAISKTLHCKVMLSYTSMYVYYLLHDYYNCIDKYLLLFHFLLNGNCL